MLAEVGNLQPKPFAADNSILGPHSKPLRAKVTEDVPAGI